jgi:hypothetical protein
MYSIEVIVNNKVVSKRYNLIINLPKIYISFNK